MTDLAAAGRDPPLGLRRRHQSRLFQQQQDRDGDDDGSNSILADDQEEEEGDNDDDDEHQSVNSRDQHDGPPQQPRPRQWIGRGWLQRILLPHFHGNQAPRQHGRQRHRQLRPAPATNTTRTGTISNIHRMDDPNVAIRASRAYCLLSTTLAVLAIVAATPPPKLSQLWAAQPPLSRTFPGGAKGPDLSKDNERSRFGASAAAPSTSPDGMCDEKSATASDGAVGDVAFFAASRDWWQAMQDMWNLQSPLSPSHVGDDEKVVHRAVKGKQSKSFAQKEAQRKNKDARTIQNPAWWARLFSSKPSVRSTNDDAESSDSQSRGSIKNRNIQFPQDSERTSNKSNNNNNNANHKEPTSWSSHHYFQNIIVSPLLRYRLYIHSWIDPVLLNPTSQTPTDVIDKVLTSTPRLLAIANFLLAMTYLLHSAVAAWFLGPEQQPHRHQDESVQVPLMVDWANGTATIAPGTNRLAHPAATAALNATGNSGARERMGGFLVFKLLLISAVVAPDTLDLLILLTWYTTLSCLRSLDHLAHATTTHLAALGQPPRTGVVQLLFLVLVCDIVAAASCVALFHAAGWGMVILLTCDCALLAADVLRHILKHLQCALEDAHATTIQDLERQQLALHNDDGNATRLDRNGARSSDHDIDDATNWDMQEGEAEDENQSNGNVGRQREPEEIQASANNMTPIEIQQESRRLDRRMEVFELAHARRLSILDSIMFTLELLCHLFTVAHFCHIWSLHGIQFTLIDGVLALHLHSAISTVCKKIGQRRNIHSIARDLQGQFPNASDEELRKASTAGDVCCICLGTMSTGGHVKKVRCGHLYHTHCLREVVQRAHTIQAAKCPLCRASLIDGTHQHSGPGSDLQRNNAAFPAPMAQQQHAAAAPDATRPAGAGDRALFRFSTEGILPTWLPIPAFSFEVVRRSPLGGAFQTVGGTQPPLQIITQQQPLPHNGEAVMGRPQMALQQTAGVPPAGRGGNNGDASPRNSPIPPAPILPPPPPQQRQRQQEMPTFSFLRRLLVLAGAIPMSPEEEARALAQLVDMFPQYDRSDLLRELQERGSAEGVAESVLMGIFSGVPRGD